ncbi:MAG: serine hydroxymethyltransferase, partial [Solirubrobacterales bacterium]
TTTHKTLRGPRGGMVLCQAKWAKELDKLVFPGMQGGPLMHVIAAKAVAFKEALLPEWKLYQAQVVKNAQVLAATLLDEGWRLVSGGTDNHLILVDVFARGITGKAAEAALDRAGITVNKNTIPHDTNSPMVASGIRVGTPALTTRGMKEVDMEQVGRLLSRALQNVANETGLAEEKREVGKLCDHFPLYASRLEAYDRALARV